MDSLQFLQLPPFIRNYTTTKHSVNQLAHIYNRVWTHSDTQNLIPRFFAPYSEGV